MPAEGNTRGSVENKNNHHAWTEVVIGVHRENYASENEKKTSTAEWHSLYFCRVQYTASTKKSVAFSYSSATEGLSNRAKSVSVLVWSRRSGG